LLSGKNGPASVVQRSLQAALNGFPVGNIIPASHHQPSSNAQHELHAAVEKGSRMPLIAKDIIPIHAEICEPISDPIKIERAACKDIYH